MGATHSPQIAISNAGVGLDLTLRGFGFTGALDAIRRERQRFESRLTYISSAKHASPEVSLFYAIEGREDRLQFFATAPFQPNEDLVILSLDRSVATVVIQFSAKVAVYHCEALLKSTTTIFQFDFDLYDIHFDLVATSTRCVLRVLSEMVFSK
ncbi:hypothetical protein [Pararhizobium sp. O133]|uniref:hypothetical protein n=1 Tax=Pararhizobium sp. O133 TaxID=3449278 RepID=UPI003F682C7C